MNRPEKRSFAEILGNVRPESEKTFGYRHFMGWVGFVIPVVFGGAALGLLVFFALGGSNSDKGGPDWFSDGSSSLMGVNTNDWNDLLVSLDRRQGTELSKANRVRLGLFAWGEGYYQE